MNRHAQYPVSPLFINRWSPRALSGEKISQEELFSLFEAARWAPSSYNNQPWRFVYGLSGTQAWDTLFNLLVPFNQEWAKYSSALILIVSHNVFEYNNKSSRTHSFDTGAAWMSMALQASLMNLVAHGMEGFDYDRARVDCDIPSDYTVEAMVAVGRPGNKEFLSEEMCKKEELSDRKKIEEFVFEGIFKK